MLTSSLMHSDGRRNSDGRVDLRAVRLDELHLICSAARTFLVDGLPGNYTGTAREQVSATAVSANALLQDVAGALGLDEYFGIGVAVSNVLINGFDQFGHAAEYAAAQPLGRDASEEAQSGALGRAR